MTKALKGLTLTALALVISCAEGPTIPLLIPSGSVSFSFTGGGGGTFNATGSLADAALHGGVYADGETTARDNSTNVSGVRPTGGNFANAVMITFKGQAAGTGTITAGCGPTDTVACNALTFYIGNDEGVSNFTCVLTSGSITLASISSSTAIGSFSGSGNCVSSANVTSAFAVTGGIFNVPLGP
jgi:hypothetical protein